MSIKTVQRTGLVWCLEKIIYFWKSLLIENISAFILHLNNCIVRLLIDMCLFKINAKLQKKNKKVRLLDRKRRTARSIASRGVMAGGIPSPVQGTPVLFRGYLLSCLVVPHCPVLGVCSVLAGVPPPHPPAPVGHGTGLWTELGYPLVGPGTGLWIGPVMGLGIPPHPRKDLVPEVGKAPRTRGLATPPEQTHTCEKINILQTTYMWVVTRRQECLSIRSVLFT